MRPKGADSERLILDRQLAFRKEAWTACLRCRADAHTAASRSQQPNDDRTGCSDTALNSAHVAAPHAAPSS